MSASDFKTLISSTAKRQSLLAGVPPAVRVLPLAALAASDLATRQGWDVGGAVREKLLGPGGDGGGAVMELGAPAEQDAEKAAGVIDDGGKEGDGDVSAGVGEGNGKESVSPTTTAAASTARTQS